MARTLFAGRVNCVKLLRLLHGGRVGNQTMRVLEEATRDVFLESGRRVVMSGGCGGRSLSWLEAGRYFDERSRSGWKEVAAALFTFAEK